ncbi:MAG: hypothetical protein M0R06_26190, partial [Sphaerochaeta sp.]|nr:hypothetical protein [Sphaerochaeta sp.]
DGKATPADADTLPIIDSEASSALKELTWANVKATLKTYFDTLYQAAGSYLTATSTDTLTNKTLSDTTTVIGSVGALTKALKFLLSGATADKTMTIASSHTDNRTLTLPDATDTLVGKATTDTLTNKRVTKRVGSTTSHATPTINTDNVDIYQLTAQAENITSFTTNLSGTPTDGQLLWIQITGTAARTITWGTSFESSTATLPIITVGTSRLDVILAWNTVTSKWRCISTF